MDESRPNLSLRAATELTQQLPRLLERFLPAAAEAQAEELQAGWSRGNHVLVTGVHVVALVAEQWKWRRGKGAAGQGRGGGMARWGMARWGMVRWGMVRRGKGAVGFLLGGNASSAFCSPRFPRLPRVPASASSPLLPLVPFNPLLFLPTVRGRDGRGLDQALPTHEYFPLLSFRLSSPGLFPLPPPLPPPPPSPTPSPPCPACHRRGHAALHPRVPPISLSDGRGHGALHPRVPASAQVTDEGMERFTRACPHLRKFSVGGCGFGTRGLNALLGGCPLLEDLTVKRRALHRPTTCLPFRAFPHTLLAPFPHLGVPSACFRAAKEASSAGHRFPVLTVFRHSSPPSPAPSPLSLRSMKPPADRALEPLTPSNLKLRRLCLKDQSNSTIWTPLLEACGNLETLILARNGGYWDRVLESSLGQKRLPELSQVYLEKLQLTDRGLQAVARCPKLEALVVVRTPDCTDAGMAAIAAGCTGLRRLHIEGWAPGHIGDTGLGAIARCCRDLQELVLVAHSCTAASLKPLATNCRGLERLTLCSSSAMGDLEMACLAYGCPSLRRLCVKGCSRVTDLGIIALANGCPSLQRLKVRRCSNVTPSSLDFLQKQRPALSITQERTRSASSSSHAHAHAHAHAHREHGAGGGAGGAARGAGGGNGGGGGVVIAEPVDGMMLGGGRRRGVERGGAWRRPQGRGRCSGGATGRRALSARLPRASCAGACGGNWRGRGSRRSWGRRGRGVDRNCRGDAVSGGDGGRGRRRRRGGRGTGRRSCAGGVAQVVQGEEDGGW
ncbi:unnamed protein product [Closterium sp. NIES-64]|nr:unnamed protein product [Closterium sp. NIES-64]